MLDSIEPATSLKHIGTLIPKGRYRIWPIRQ